MKLNASRQPLLILYRIVDLSAMQENGSTEVIRHELLT